MATHEPSGRSRFSRTAKILAVSSLLMLGLSQQTVAQGLLVVIDPDSRHRLPRPIVRPEPQPPGSYKIESIDVQTKLSDQIARVQVSQTFVNTGSRQMEAAFVFPLPYDGAIDRLTLLVDGKEFAARLLTAEEARKTYEEIVRKNQDPALLEWIGTGMFKTSVFPLPAGATRTVTLRYTQLCRSTSGLTDFLFPLRTAKYTSQPLERLTIRVSIDSQTPIKSVYSATHSVKTERPDDRHAVVQHESKDVLPGEDFRLFYDVDAGSVGASVISYRPSKDNPGYFLLLTSPEIKNPTDEQPAKTVVFVVDRSGSMSGEKIEQAKGALKFVLNNLRQDDLFNIVAYDSEIESFRPELERFNDESRRAATGFVEGLFAGGSTDIHAALKRALAMLQDSSRPTYVIFLTDGLPTTGETGEAAIVAQSEKANHVRARLFTFGVGYDVNSRLLDKLARANFGQSEYVRPNEDIEVAVSKLYGRIDAPVMTDVSVSFEIDDATGAAPVVNRIYPKDSFDLFAGEQAVVVGRYRTGGAAKVTLRGSIAGQEERFDFPAQLTRHSDDDTNSFVAKLWATRRIGEIIDELDLQGKNEELIAELVQLAKEHGILTPYTSFLADETSDVRDLATGVRRSLSEVEALSESSGRFGFRQRDFKGQLQRAASAPAAGVGGYGGLEGNADGSADGFGGMPIANEERLKLLQSGGRGTVWYDYRSDRQLATTNVWNAGRKTFFQRAGRWVDSSVSEEEERSAQKIERYSREYFDLVSRHGRHVAQYLAVDEPIVIKLGSQVYEW